MAFLSYRYHAHRHLDREVWLAPTALPRTLTMEMRPLEYIVIAIIVAAACLDIILYTRFCNGPDDVKPPE